MSLKEEIANCEQCPLYKKMPCGCRPVCGNGNMPSDYMFISGSLSKDDSVMEEPLSGQLGQLFEKILKLAGLSRETCYTTMAVKCFCKGKPTKLTEIKCSGWLAKEFKEVKPKYIFTLGKTALSYFKYIEMEDGLEDYIGKEFMFRGSTVVPLYSMNYLFQRSSLDVKNTVETIRRYVNG